MKRYDSRNSKYIENKLVEAFLGAVASLCKKHGFSISHEDGHGAFVIVPYSKGNVDWLLAAQVDLED